MASAAAAVAAVRNAERKCQDDVEDFSAFKQLPSVEERLIDTALNIRLRGCVHIL